MKIQSIRITNFRSIIDSGWVQLSPDGITVLVGQNESGKTSILEATHYALSRENLTGNDFRIGADAPRIQIKIINAKYSEIDDDLKNEEFTLGYCNAVERFISNSNGSFVLNIDWEINSTGECEKSFSIESGLFSSLLEEESNNARIEAEKKEQQLSEQGTPATVAGAVATVAAFAISAATKTKLQEQYKQTKFPEFVWTILPLTVLFNEETGRLPDNVDIDDQGKPTGTGASAAQNYLDIAEVDLSKLVKSDERTRENILNRANAKVSNAFTSFWSQTIGKSGRLELKCNIKNYSSDKPEKAGKPYLVFWICDGNTQLYPMQRSQGVRWFISFFLQLKASENRKQNRIFLLDEPGANLHSKAQADVLKLINQLGKDTSMVIYSTHSPQLLEYSKLFRVHAVQRSDDQDDSPTIVIDAHQLGTASSDTLSPILTAMGVDLSHQQVIRRDHNVLLEEMSGYYYLTSFWQLTDTKCEAHFIAATGVNKIEALANMFRGWGLDFIVAVDDDKQGREAFKSLKRELFGDDETLSQGKLLKFPDCPGIEDAFSTNDFKTYVLNDPEATFSEANSSYLKTAGRSKPVIAFNFALAVNERKIKWTDFEKSTQKKITAIVSALVSRLA